MMTSMFVGFMLLIKFNLALSACQTSTHFCYANGHESECVGPACWHQFLPSASSPPTTVCGSEGTRQSPIDIDTSSVVEDDDIEVKLDEDKDIAKGGTLKNTGHSVQLIFDNEEYRYTIKKVSGDDDFDVIQMHFHFGIANDKGSEHTVNGNAYEGELHCVGVHGSELAVLGFFLEVSPAYSNNTKLQKLVEHFGSIKHTDDTHPITDFDLKDLVKKSMKENQVFYRYLGSLTTPPCSEIVTWTVFATPIKVSQAQMDDFRNKIELDHHSDDNFRPVQNDNNENMVVKKGFTDD